MNRSLKVAVLVGCSSEREISLKTAKGVSAALSEKGYQPVTLEIDAGLACRINTEKPDLAFIASHGRFGEDGTIQGLLEIMGIPYVGSGVLASALAIDKAMSKTIFRQIGIRTPESWSYSAAEPWQERMQPLIAHLENIGPLIVKPTRQGSTIGLSVVRSPLDLIPAMLEAFRYDDNLLVEWMIQGAELAIPVLDELEPTVLPCVEIVPKNEIYDYESKYSPGMSEHVIPPRLPSEVIAEAERMAVAAHLALGCRDLTRSDLIVDKEGRCWLLEVNTLPGMTETSLVPDSARAAGIGYADLIEKLIEMVRTRF